MSNSFQPQIKPIASTSPQFETASTGVVLEKEIMTISDENPVAVASAYKERLKQDPSVINIANSLALNNTEQILAFGQEPALEISRFSDTILNSMRGDSVQNSSKMIKELTKIMNKFDKKEFEKIGEKRGIMGLFKKVEDALDKLLSKYQSMGKEIDVVNGELVKYKQELNAMNNSLEQQYEQNFLFYKSLEKYIVAGEMIIQHFENVILKEAEEQAKSQLPEHLQQLETYRMMHQMLQTRVYDLEMAKTVALTTAPQIRMIQKANFSLIAKIQSAFIITIPIFKQGLINAVALKRQAIMVGSLNELQKNTERILIQNSQDVSNQSAQTAQLAGSPSIQIETIEQVMSNIFRGMEETQRIEEENKKKRIEGTKRLEELTSEFKNKMQKKQP